MTQLGSWKILVEDGDVSIKYKVHQDEMVTLKYIKHFADTEDIVTDMNIFLDELKLLCESVNKLLDKK